MSGRSRLLDSDTAQLVITALASLLGVSSIFRAMWPIKSIWWFLGACILSVIVTALLTALSAILYFIIIHFVMIVCSPAYAIYTICAERAFKRKRREKSMEAGRGMDSGPEADVGIRYFIEQEKGRSPYHAEFLDC